MRISTVLAVVLAAIMMATPAGAAAKKYSSCDKLLAVYPAGIARDAQAAAAAQAAGMIAPTVNRALYKANAGRLDRDRDGVACEQPA